MADRDGGLLARVAQCDVQQQQMAERQAHEVKAKTTHLSPASQDSEYLQAAFTKFCTGDSKGAIRLLEEVADVSQAVLTFSKDIADANPTDPRWAEQVATRSQSTMSSQVSSDLHVVNLGTKPLNGVCMILQIWKCLSHPPSWLFIPFTSHRICTLCV
jgi:hypothetical protein